MTVIWEINTFTFEEKLAQSRGALVEVLAGVVLGAPEDVLVVEVPSLVVLPSLAVLPPLVVEPALLELHEAYDGVVLPPLLVVAVVEAPHELAALRRASKRLQLLLPSSEIVLAIVSSAN
jgi:hypothetical protein